MLCFFDHDFYFSDQCLALKMTQSNRVLFFLLILGSNGTYSSSNFETSTTINITTTFCLNKFPNTKSFTTLTSVQPFNLFHPKYCNIEKVFTNKLAKYTVNASQGRIKPILEPFIAHDKVPVFIIFAKIDQSNNTFEYLQNFQKCQNVLVLPKVNSKIIKFYFMYKPDKTYQYRNVTVHFNQTYSHLCFAFNDYSPFDYSPFYIIGCTACIVCLFLILSLCCFCGYKAWNCFKCKKSQIQDASFEFNFYSKKPCKSLSYFCVF